jgi:alpha-D-xyloside xylohydrolase
VPGLGFRRSCGAAEPFFSWRICPGDRFYGLGEKFTRFEKTSTRSVIWAADACGSNTTDLSYKGIPFLLSTAGYALLLPTTYRSTWDVGAFNQMAGSVLTEDAGLELHVLLAPALKGQLAHYLDLTGRPAQPPPKWAFGLWMSRAMYYNRAEMTEARDGLGACGIPCDVLHSDGWQPENRYHDLGVDVCNFEWGEAAWGEPEAFFADFARHDVGVSVWVNPYVSRDSAMYAEGEAHGYLVRDPRGEPARLEFDLNAAAVDFTNPAAKAWWQGKLKALLNQGAAVCKPDYGDRIPADAVFYDGKTGREMHNLYPHLYVEAAYEATLEANGYGLVWRRPGYIGSQRYPVCWSGDTQTNWPGMAGTLRGGLSAALSGEGFWGHDIGGFAGPKPTEELYIRWAQFGLLSPLARFHGARGTREPWAYGEKAVEVVRDYARLRYSLIPYLLAVAHEAVATGMPMLRPLALEYQGDPAAEQVDDQYLLGPSLLVAPILRAGAVERWVYLPEGQWWDFAAPGAPLNGPAYHRLPAPLEHMPLLAAGGSVIPRYARPPMHLKGHVQQWALDVLPGRGQGALHVPEQGFIVDVAWQMDERGGALEVSPAPVDLAIRLLGRPEARITCRPAPAQLTMDAATLIVHTEGRQGVHLEFSI